MSAERRIARVLAEKWADDRAHRIATMASESLVRTEGVPTSRPDEFAIQADPDDEQMRDALAHLEWHGLATSGDTGSGWIWVNLEPQDE